MRVVGRVVHGAFSSWMICCGGAWSGPCRGSDIIAYLSKRSQLPRTRHHSHSLSRARHQNNSIWPTQQGENMTMSCFFFFSGSRWPEKPIALGRPAVRQLEVAGMGAVGDPVAVAVLDRPLPRSHGHVVADARLVALVQAGGPAAGTVGRVHEDADARLGAARGLLQDRVGHGAFPPAVEDYHPASRSAMARNHGRSREPSSTPFALGTSMHRATRVRNTLAAVGLCATPRPPERLCA